MAVVSAFIVPSSPLPFVQRDNPPWGAIADAMDKAGESLVASDPDTIVVYSTQWFAVLDQLWQAKPHLTGVHVDENWHEYGELPFDIHIDTDLTGACVNATEAAGIKTKGVNYDQFPIDTGTIVAANFLNPGNERPLAIAANNLYHDGEKTEILGRIAREAADTLDKKIAVVAIGGLSGSFYRHTIDIEDDKIVSKEEDVWNQRILNLLEKGDLDGLKEAWPTYATEAKADFGFKHLSFVLGALGGKLGGATVHGYGPLYGTGAAVIEFDVT